MGWGWGGERDTYSATAHLSGSKFPLVTRWLWPQDLISEFSLDSSYPFSDYKGRKDKEMSYIIKEYQEMRCEPVTCNWPLAPVLLSRPAIL